MKWPLNYLRMKHRFYADTKYIKSASIGAFTQMIFFFSFLSKHRERETFKKWRICEKIRKANGREKKIFGYISCRMDIRK